jgi:hypothetical protein
VHWLNRKEVEVQLGRRPTWYEQFLISRCNFSKSLEQKFYASADPEERRELVVKLVAAERCGKELPRPEARAFLTAELKRAAQGAADK